MHRKSRSALIFTTYLFLFAVIFFCAFRNAKAIFHAAGRLEVVSGSENYYYDKSHDRRIPGMDIEGVTYYFLPSYIESDEIVQTSDSVRIFLKNGDILNRTRFGEVQEVLVDFGNGERLPWKMCFMRSENIASIFIDFPDPAVWDELNTTDYTAASVRVIEAGGDTDYSDEIMIKGRGNSTWMTWSKKPLEIMLPARASICGLKPSKKWVFLANYFDPTFMQNKVAYDLAEDIGLKYTTDSEWADVYRDGMYEGMYLICKEPKISEGSVNIGSMEASNDVFFDSAKPASEGDISGYKYPDVTPVDGGYLIKKESGEPYEKKQCRFDASGKTFVVRSPGNASLEQVRFIRDFVDRITYEIDQKGNAAKYLDTDSLARRFLIEEFMFNADAFVRSYYFYKKSKEEMLYAGPCWDYDDSCGQVKENEVLMDYNGSLLSDKTLDGRLEKGIWLDWELNLYNEDEGYRQKLKEVFQDNMYLFEKTITDKIPEYQKKIQASAAMDNVIWPDTRKTYGEYEDNIRFLQFFLYRRLKHMVKMYGCEKEPEFFDVNKNEYHKVIFIMNDGSPVTMCVADGKQFEKEELPKIDEDRYYWCNMLRDETRYSPYIPVYEDTVFELKEKDEDDT